MADVYAQLLELVSGLEFWGMVTNLACVWYAAREKMAIWPVGVAGILIYFVMFWQAHLVGSALLQLFFMALQFYGRYYWTTEKGRNRTHRTKHLNWQEAVVFAATGVAGYAFVGWAIPRFFPESVLPFWDSAILAGSVAAQQLLNRKVLQNWFVWNSVDVISVVLYWHSGLYLTSLTYFVFLVLSVKGYLDWCREMAAEAAASTTA
ncbi:MAG TPA: nicotinamide riboside transporter PnuC [Symbiobacteriaceae bacterium]|nr:nicotinamide riboside transporter PnuC [Symbiobacteriaceae bacterium]